MIRTTGTIYEVLCPYCEVLIKHIHRLKTIAPGTLIQCRNCKRQSEVDRTWVEGEVWPMLSLLASSVVAEEGGAD